MSNYIYIEQNKPDWRRPVEEKRPENDRFANRRGVMIIGNDGEIEYDSNRPETVTKNKTVLQFD